MKKDDSSQIIIYQSEDGLTKIDVHFDNETVWLSQQQISALYKTSRTSIVEHIKHIYDEEELKKDSTCRDFRQVQLEGGTDVYFGLVIIPTVRHDESTPTLSLSMEVMKWCVETGTSIDIDLYVSCPEEDVDDYTLNT